MTPPLPRKPTALLSPPPPPGGSERERSAASSTASSGASEFVADPGPAFDPGNAPEAPLFDDDVDPLVEEGWREETVRDILLTQGEITHWALKVGDDEHDPDSWEHTEKDLQRIAPPLTRVLNRYDVTRALGAAGDEAVLVAALTAYVAKNYTKRRRLQLELRDQAPQPLTGVAADPDLGPNHDPEYQRVHEPPPALRPKGARR